MFKNFMILTATTSFMALAAPHTASFAQSAPGDTGNFLEDTKRHCREDAANDGWRDGLRYTDWANTESRQAADYRELEQNALNNAKASSSAADQAMWNADAARYAKNAQDLESQAQRDLARGKAGFAKFREQEPCAEVVAALEDYMNAVIEDGAMRADPKFWDETPKMIERVDTPDEEKAEPKVDPAPRQEKKKLSVKKPPKTEKTKKRAQLKKPRTATQDAAQSIARDVAVTVASQIILGELTGKHHRREKHENYERREITDGMAMEEFQPRRRMKIRKLMGVGFGMF